jgi:hypothetical protein
MVTLIAVALSAALLAPALIYPYFEDSALFAAVARYLLEGEILYQDVFDHKAPAIYLQEMIRISLLGPSSLASRVFELAILLIAALALGSGVHSLRAEEEDPPGLALLILVPASFCALTSSSLWALPERGQVEFFQAAAVAIGLSSGLFSIRRPRSLFLAMLSGASLAWAAWLKPQAALLLIGFFLVLFWEARRTTEGRRRPWLLALGTLAVSLVVLLFLLVSGNLQGLLHLFLEHHPAYLSGVRPIPPELHSRFIHYFLRSPRNYAVAVLVVLGIIRLFRVAKKGRIPWSSLRGD